MSRKSQDANAVTYAVRQVCGLYGVELLRMQSRTITVTGKAGRARPMFIGQWTDMQGQEHYSGMADLLLRPRVPVAAFTDARFAGDMTRITVPLWVEIKSGRDKLTVEQLLFKQYVEANGESWLNVHDDVRPLMDWFESRGVKK